MTKSEEAVIQLSALATILEATRGECEWESAVGYINNAISVIKETQPKLLSLDEVKEIGRAEETNINPENTIVLWIESLEGLWGDIVSLYPSVLSYDYHPEWGNDEDDDYSYRMLFGSDRSERLYSSDYGKTWRAWTAKPDTKLRNATMWEKQS